MTYDRNGLTIEIDEVSVPLPRRIRGRIHLTPTVVTTTEYPLDAAGRHLWQPIAPIASVEAVFESPGLRFSGQGYLDSNWGSEPLEQGFRLWSWSRAMVGSRAAVLYDCERRDGSKAGLALMIGLDGKVTSFLPPSPVDLPGTLWRMPRSTRSDDGHPARILRTLEDAPFYNRSIIAATVEGAEITAMHETLSLDRFSKPIVQWMLPFRMPRWR